MLNKLKVKKLNKRQLKIIGIIILLLALPLLLSTLYFIQDTRSRAALPDQLESESGVLSSSGVTKQTSTSASGGQYVRFAKSTTSPSPTPTPSNKIYGPGIAIDSKSNRRIGDGGPGDNRSISHRFIASTTSRAVSLSWELRLGSGYSLGDGGILKISLQTDDGTSNHFPSGKILDSYTFTPGNSSTGGRNVRQNFPNKPLLNEGQIYHVVFENISSDPVNNYVSVNEIFNYKAYNPRQPNPDFAGIYAVLNGNKGVWSLDNNHTAQMDLAYENGIHDGQAYSQAMWNQPGSSSDPELVGIIEGQRQARELFTVQESNKTVTAAFVRVAQEYGSGSLNIALKNSSGAILGQGSVLASEISDYAADPNWYLAQRGDQNIAGDWVSIKFNSPITLNSGSTYQLVMTAPSGTKYAMSPIRYQGWDEVTHASFAFREGRAQMSSDGGITWENNYSFQPYNNYQFYFTLQ
jgi:hypothetical protein